MNGIPQIVSLNYTEVPLFTVTEATKTINVSEELTFFWAGSLKMDPPADIWVDQTTLPANQVDTRGDFAAWQMITNNVPMSTEWGAWNNTWTNTSVSGSDATVSTSSTSSTAEAIVTTNRNVTTHTTTTTDSTGQARSGVSTLVTSAERQVDLGTRLADFQVEHYLRPRNILMGVTKMKPNSHLQIIFDNVDVSTMCYPVTNAAELYATFSVTLARYSPLSAPILTDAAGNAIFVFSVPQNRFLVGNKKVSISEYSPSPKTGASGAFDASGFSISKQTTILSTRVPVIAQQPAQDSRVLTNSTSVSAITGDTTAISTQLLPTTTTSPPVTIAPTTSPPVTRPPCDGRVYYRSRCGNSESASGCAGDTHINWPSGDVTPINYPMTVCGGRSVPCGADPLAQTFFIDQTCILTSIELFFYAKSDTEGLTLELREVVNGYPGPTILPMGTSSKPSSDISVSNDSSTPTKFEFHQPVILLGDKEYCFVVKPDGNSIDYQAWVVEIGGYDVATRQRVTRSPFSGSVFTSQNNTVWTARQSLDLKMNANIAKVDISQAGTFDIVNADIDNISISNVTGAFIIGERVEQIIDQSTTAIGYVESVDSKSITLTESNGKFVTTIDNNAIGKIYGRTSNALADIVKFNDVVVDLIQAQISFLAFNDTSAKFSLTYNTTGSSDQTLDINPNTDITLQYPALVRSRTNEVNLYGGKKSMRISVEMSSTNDKMTPIFDMAKCGIIMISNKVGNTPLGNETYDGDSESDNAKYITQPIVLAEGMDAEDLVVYLTAEIPTGSHVDVFYKCINTSDVSDKTQNYSKHAWNLMQSDGTVSGTSDAIEYKYTPLETVYDSDRILNYTQDGVSYAGFKVYMVKIVMRAEVSSKIPTIKNFRSIALQA